MTGARWTTLPCGVDPTHLVTFAAEGTAPPTGSHEATCPYCQAAVGEFAELWQPVTEWTQREIRVPDRFLATVMSRVRRLVQSPRHAIAVSARGTTTVTSWVLGLIASSATRDTPGVSSITGTSSDAPRRRAAVRYGAEGVDITEVDEHDISANLGIIAHSQLDLADLADTVRHNVITAVRDHTSLQVAEVDISIDDLDLSS